MSTKKSAFLLLSVLSLHFISCAEMEADGVQNIDKLSSATLRNNLMTLSERAALRGLYQITPIAGIANAETGLAHCWSDATWACKGPASTSCGGGPIIAGSGDGQCWREQGGLGLFQLDGGTYAQTLSREGAKVLTLSGNIDAGLDFIINMVKSAKSLSTDREAINWINGISIGSARYNDWLDLVVERYNGCQRGRCSIFTQRWYHYDGKTRSIAQEVSRLPTPSRGTWIGVECASDNDCAFSVEAGSGRCLLGESRGVCVTSCEGYCPDRSGFATTFCADSSQINGDEGGICLGRSHSLNGYCSTSEERTISRYVGSSGAASREERVCVPKNMDAANVQGNLTTDTQPEDQGHGGLSMGSGDLCQAPELPLSEESCPIPDEGLWRCACHETYHVSVSQVCRSGAWVSYRLNPRNCAQCSGVDSRGCN